MNVWQPAVRSQVRERRLSEIGSSQSILGNRLLINAFPYSMRQRVNAPPPLSTTEFWAAEGE